MARPIITPGQILIAEPFLEGDYFSRSVVGITEHGKGGTMGFILNKPIRVKFKDLIPNITSDENYSVFKGGPVATDSLHFIHNVGDLLEDSIEIKNGLYMGGKFEKLIFLINSGLILKENIRFYIGYSGWSEGQLSEEMKNGSWIVSDWHSNYTFKSKAHTLWTETLRHKGDHYSVIAQIPKNINSN